MVAGRPAEWLSLCLAASREADLRETVPGIWMKCGAEYEARPFPAPGVRVTQLRLCRLWCHVTLALKHIPS
jgi:hypothetical protein